MGCQHSNCYYNKGLYSLIGKFIRFIDTRKRAEFYFRPLFLFLFLSFFFSLLSFSDEEAFLRHLYLLLCYFSRPSLCNSCAPFLSFPLPSLSFPSLCHSVPLVIPAPSVIPECIYRESTSLT